MVICRNHTALCHTHSFAQATELRPRHQIPAGALTKGWHDNFRFATGTVISWFLWFRPMTSTTLHSSLAPSVRHTWGGYKLLMGTHWLSAPGGGHRDPPRNCPQCSALPAGKAVPTAASRGATWAVFLLTKPLLAAPVLPGKKAIPSESQIPELGEQRARDPAGGGSQQGQIQGKISSSALQLGCSRGCLLIPLCYSSSER